MAAKVVRSLVGPSPIPAHSLRKLPEEAGHADDRPFQVVLWRSLRHAPSLTEMLRTWVVFLAKREVDIPPGQDEQISMLIECLRHWRCLLILDDAQGILRKADTTVGNAQEYREYSNFFKRIATSDHQSCLLLISDEQFPEIEPLIQSVESSAREMRLPPLSRQASRLLLRRQGIEAEDAVLDCAAQRFAGHPLALLETVHITKQLFAGDVAAYLDAGLPISGVLRDLLVEHFARLSPLEREILCVLAETDTPLSWNRLNASLSSAPLAPDLLEALLVLLRRFLIEKGSDGFRLPALVAEYMQNSQR